MRVTEDATTRKEIDSAGETTGAYSRELEVEENGVLFLNLAYLNCAQGNLLDVRLVAWKSPRRLGTAEHFADEGVNFEDLESSSQHNTSTNKICRNHSECPWEVEL